MVDGTATILGGPLPALLYLRPSFGGIFDYSESVIAILRSQSPPRSVEVLTVVTDAGDPLLEGLRLARKIRARPGVIYADLGINDAAMFWAIYTVCRERKVVLTIHDPGAVVTGLFRSDRLDHVPAIRRIARKAAFRLERRAGSWLIQRTLRSCAERLVLNAAVSEVRGLPVGYLPPPVHNASRIAHPLPEPPKIAFLGYWGLVKGIEELLEAYRALLPRFPTCRFVIAGGGVGPNAPYEQEFRRRVAAVSSRIELPGFIAPAEMDTFLSSLTALVLPYHPELASGASGMLMRAQEAGVPLVVTDTPMLRAQVHQDHVVMVPSRDVEALASALAGLLADQPTHNARAEGEQLRIHREHGKVVVGDRLAAILGRLAT